MTDHELATQKMLTRLAADIAALKTLAEQTRHDLHGNGRPGLLDRVTRLETKVGMVAGVAGVIASLLAELIKHFF
jgi:cytolysin (calcineurin-like family phosphatase)